MRGLKSVSTSGVMHVPLYTPSDRNYSFDTNFTQGPQWLPPDTPSLRSLNTMGFTQEIMPTQ